MNNYASIIPLSISLVSIDIMCNTIAVTKRELAHNNNYNNYNYNLYKLSFVDKQGIKFNVESNIIVDVSHKFLKRLIMPRGRRGIFRVGRKTRWRLHLG